MILGFTIGLIVAVFMAWVERKDLGFKIFWICMSTIILIVLIINIINKIN